LGVVATLIYAPILSLSSETLGGCQQECKERNINTSEVKDALDLLERYIQPEWLVP
jgi:hypothetical protein